MARASSASQPSRRAGMNARSACPRAWNCSSPSIGEQQREDLLLPELEERLGCQFGQRQKRALGQEHPFGDQRVNMRMPMD